MERSQSSTWALQVDDDHVDDDDDQDDNDDHDEDMMIMMMVKMRMLIRQSTNSLSAIGWLLGPFRPLQD